MRRSTAVFLAAIAGLLAGLGLGILIGGNAPPVAAAARLSSGEGVRAGAEPAGSGEDAAPAAAGPERTPMPVARVESIHAGERETGSGILTGTVEDDAGEPVAGVTVRATREDRSLPPPPPPGAGPPAEKTLEQAVEEAVSAYRSERSRRFDAVTDARGRYEIQKLPDATFLVEAWKEGLVLEPVQEHRGVRPGESVDFRAERVYQVRIAVLLPGGRTPDEATVHATSHHGRGTATTRQRWTSAAPSVRLREGLHELSASLDADPSAAARGTDMLSDAVEIEVPGAEGPVTLLLRPRRAIRGRVLYDRTMPRERYLVAARRLEPGEPADPSLLEERRDLTTWSAQDTRDYAFLDLAAGRYLVGVSRNWNSEILAHAEVAVADGTAFLDLEVPELVEDTVLVAVVRDDRDRPMPRVRFRYRIETETSTSSSSIRPAQTPDGEYWITPNEQLAEFLRGATPEARATLSAQTEIGHHTVDLEPGRRRYEFRFDASGYVLASVDGYVGSGLEGDLQLSLAHATSGYTTGRRNASADGPVRLGPVEAGEYALVLTLRNTRNRFSRTYEIRRVGVTVKPGDLRASVAIPPLYTVRVGSADAPEGTVTLRGRNGGTRLSAPIEGGEARIQLVPAGDYFVDRSGAGHSGRMRITVPAQTNVEFSSEPQDVAAVTIRDEDGYLAQAGLADGDLIVAIGGAGFEGQTGFDLALLRHEGDGDIPVTVLRDGGELVRRVDPRRLVEKRDLGGWVRVTYRP